MDRMDNYDSFSPGMRAYLSNHGWHISKGLFEHAVKKMKKRDGQPVAPLTKEQIDAKLKQYGVTLKNDKLYDAAYVWQMCMADYYGSSVKDEGAVALFVRDYLDDVDGDPTRAMDEYYARCIGMGCPIDWYGVL